ncbi:hypothetical protein CASFOL_030410 [Castilleja foliolosa]|uniref:ATP synthase protein MI25 n=1 Tax=Castilleja foliolosa TaxID=1961234 RepID=A0ABD3C7W8_9LAMI
MGSLSGLGIGLSFIFGCILMGVVAELYYLLWWKKRLSHNSSTNPEIEESCFLFSWKKKKPCLKANPQEQPSVDLETGSIKDSLGPKGYGEEGIEAEIMRMHNLCGPPRFLFTIKEESREDLESEDGKSRRGSRRTKSFSDFLLSSPTVVKANNNNSCFSSEEVKRFRSSPPPKFKFLKDAEDKLIRKLLLEEAEKKRAALKIQDSNCGVKDEDKINDFSFC